MTTWETIKFTLKEWWWSNRGAVEAPPIIYPPASERSAFHRTAMLVNENYRKSFDKDGRA